MCIFHALVMQCTQPPLTHTFATLVMHWSIPCFFILACHVYLMLCSILHCLRFELHFLIHLAPLMYHYHYSFLHLLPSFLLGPLSIPDKKGESTLESIPECFVIFIWLLCTSLGRENLFCLCVFMFVFLFALWCFELCLVSMLCCFHCIMFVCWTCILPYAIMIRWLHVRMIICFAM